jgi:phosphoesterase RecJ-like protein
VSRFFPALEEAFARMLVAVEGKRIAVVGHARPDGDCIGTQVAVCRLLRARGVDAVAVNIDPVPRRLQFLVGDTPFVSGRDAVLGTAGLGDRSAIFTDCADRARPGPDLAGLFLRPLGNIDHHLSNEGFAVADVVDPAAAAAAEIVAGLMVDFGLPIDPVAARALYVGIATDTGQFRFPSTSRRVFDLVGRLLDAGVDPAAAAEEVYERESFEKLELLGRFLESLRRECGGRVCIGFLTTRDFAETGASREDTEGLVDYARAIDGVDIGILVEERADGIKASLRAKSPAMRVDRIAARFGGGGHACAAGLNVPGGGPDFLAQLVAAVAAQLDAAVVATSQT